MDVEGRKAGHPRQVFQRYWLIHVLLDVPNHQGQADLIIQFYVPFEGAAAIPGESIGYALFIACWILIRYPFLRKPGSIVYNYQHQSEE